MNVIRFACSIVLATSCLAACAAEPEEPVGESGEALQETTVECAYDNPYGALFDGSSDYRQQVEHWVDDKVTDACHATTKGATGEWRATFSGPHASSYNVSGPNDGKFNRCITNALAEREPTMRPHLKSAQPCYLRFAFAPR